RGDPVHDYVNAGERYHRSAWLTRPLQEASRSQAPWSPGCASPGPRPPGHRPSSMTSCSSLLDVFRRRIVARVGPIARGISDRRAQGTLASHLHSLHGPLGAAYGRSRAGQADQPRSPPPCEKDAILLACPDSGLELVPLELFFVEVVIQKDD